MIKITLQRREPLPTIYRIFLPVAAILLALLTASIYVLIAHGDVFKVYYYLITWPFENPTEIFVTATPLILLAFSVMVAFRARFWNLGPHGQFIAGGLMAAWIGVQLGGLSSYLLIPFIYVLAWLAGSAVCLISWWLKVKRNQDEVLTTLLIWSAMLQINAGLLTGPLKSPYTTYPQSAEISPNAMLPFLIPNTRFHAGVILPFIVLAFLWILFTKTTIRDKITAATVPRVATLEGINVPSVYFWVAFISGGIAGLAGANEVMGLLHYMTPFVGPNYGLVALATAMLGGLNPIGVTIATLFYSIIINGANAMSWNTGVPSFLSDIIQAQALIFFLILGVLNNYRIVVVRKPAPKPAAPPKLSIQKFTNGGVGISRPMEFKVTGILRSNAVRIPALLIGTAIVLSIIRLMFPAIKGSFADLFTSSMISLTIFTATPIVFAAMGEMLLEKTGVINLGIWGIMIAGAGWGFMAAYFMNNLFYGILVAAIIGAIFGAILAFLVVTLEAQQHIAGVAVTFYAMNITYFIHRVLIGSPLVEPTLPQTRVWKIPFIGDAPFIGALFNQTLYTYIGIYLVTPLLFLILYKTRWGLIIRAVGENPKAADALKIRVHLVRYLAIIVGSALMAIGGAFYPLIDLRTFNLNVGGEWSWIAMALVVLGNWNPIWIWLACVFFGSLNAAQAWLTTTTAQIPYQFLLAIPYLLTVGLSAIFGKRVRPPKAILQAYRRE